MASLQNIVAEAQATQSGVTTKGLGENSYGVKATLNAKLPEGLKANLKFSDKTISSVRTPACARDAGGRAPIGARARAAARMCPNPRFQA